MNLKCLWSLGILCSLVASGVNADTLNAPTSLTATVLSSTQIRLNWVDNSSNELKFKIDRRRICGICSSSFRQVGRTNANVTTFTDKDLLPSATYEYRVFAYARKMASYSNMALVTTPNPDASPAASASPTAAPSATPSPSPSASPRATPSPSPSPSASPRATPSPSPSPSASPRATPSPSPSVSPAASASPQASASPAASPSAAPSASPGSTDTTPPSVPVIISAAATTQFSVDVKWYMSTDSGSGVAGYYVFRNNDPTPIIWGADDQLINLYQHEPLTPPQTITYKIKAIDFAGNMSGFSSSITVSIVTNPTPAPSVAPSVAPIIIPNPPPGGYIVRPVYFVTSGHSPYPGWEAKLKSAWSYIYKFYDEEMKRNGFPGGFNLARDPDGTPHIYLVQLPRDYEYYRVKPGEVSFMCKNRVMDDVYPATGFSLSKDLIAAVSDQDCSYSGGAGVAIASPIYFEALGNTRSEMLQKFCSSNWLPDNLQPPYVPPQNGQPARGCNLTTRSPECYTYGQTSSYHLGGLMHEMAHTFGASHTTNNADVVDLGYTGLGNYFHKTPANPAPCRGGNAPMTIGPDSALVFGVHRMFRPETTYADNTIPLIKNFYVAPTVVGQDTTATIEFHDNDSELHTGYLRFDNLVRYHFDLRNVGHSRTVTFRIPSKFASRYSESDPDGAGPLTGYLAGDTRPARPYLITVNVWDKSGNHNTAERDWHVFNTMPSPVPRPVLDPTEVPWIEEYTPDGAIYNGGDSKEWKFSNLIVASGASSIKLFAEAGRNWFQFESDPVGFPIGTNESIMAYVYIDDPAQTQSVGIVIQHNNTIYERFYWGDDTFGFANAPYKRRMGPLPPARQWHRLEIPASTFRISNTSIKGLFIESFGPGQVYFDRIGRMSGSDPWAAPTLVANETSWFDEIFPLTTLNNVTGPIHWANAVTPASGNYYLVQSASGGMSQVGFNVTASTMQTHGSDILKASVYIEPGSNLDMIAVEWTAQSSAPARAYWGVNRLEGSSLQDTYMGPIPSARGSWVTLNMPARNIGIPWKVLMGLTFRINGTGTVYWDRVGKVSLPPLTIPPAPTTFEAGDFVFFDDAFPNGASNGNQTLWIWDTRIKASGTQSHEQPTQTGVSFNLFAGASPGLVMNSAEKLITYVYMPDPTPPEMIGIAVYSSGGAKIAYWGTNKDTSSIGFGNTQKVFIGNMVATGSWVRLEIPVTTIGYTNQSIVNIGFMSYGTPRVFWDRTGKR